MKQFPLFALLIVLVLTACSSPSTPTYEPEPEPEPSYPNAQGNWIDNNATALFCGQSEPAALALDITQNSDGELSGNLTLRTMSGTQYVYSFDGNVYYDSEVTGIAQGSNLQSLVADLSLSSNVMAGNLEGVTLYDCGDGTIDYLNFNVRFLR